MSAHPITGCRRFAVVAACFAIAGLAVASAARSATPVNDTWGPVVYAPDSVDVTAADTTSLSVAWSAVGRAGDPTSYRVYRNGVLIETDTGLGTTMAGLGCGRTYAVGIVAVDGAGDASAAATIMASTVQCRTPAVPVTLSVPQSVGPDSVLSATATGSISSIAFGYCPGDTCTWATATPIDSVAGSGQADVKWSSLPADGTYSIVARATDASGATGDSNRAVVSVDTAAPSVSIASGPAGFSTATANFAFTSNETVSRYECNVDGSGFFACNSNFTLSELDGAHTLQVRSVDLAGNVDPTPASSTWTVDVDPPDTSLVSGPPPTPVDTATFVFASTEPGSFQCKLDAQPYTACSSPLSLFGLSAGTHKLSVRAVDLAGNVDPTPLVATWTATAPTVGPDTTITSAPPSLINTRSVLISFASNIPFASFQCSVDGGAFVGCLNPRPINSLADGTHTFQVRAVVGGRVDPTPATASFTVDATAPNVTITPSRPFDSAAGWYRSPVTFTTTGADAGGAVTCSDPQTYGGPDVSHLAILGSCTDTAGNTRTKTFDLRYDTTPPAIRVAFRVRDRNGWYNRPFNITFLGTDATSGGVVCDPVVHYEGPDTPDGSIGGTCTDAAGNSSSTTFPFKYDDTDPVVTATPSRTPDLNGWYNAPLTVGFDGTDAMSGGVTCDAPVDYAGPDSGAATVTGNCSDAAGNIVPASLTLAYDATPPAVTLTATRPPDPDGAYHGPVTFDVSGTDNTSGGVTCDGPITYSGPDSATATVNGSCTDAAGNKGTGSATFSYQTAPPDTSLTSTPGKLTNQSSAQFAFTSTKSGSTFQCSLDGAAASDCTSPQSYSGLADGQHTFSVAATDSTGNSDPTPATFSWTIDTVAPDTAFTATPPDPNNTAASFSITTDADASLQCSLDNAAFAACTSPVSIGLSSLPDGSHTFRARGVDAAGNVDATPASFTWTTDTIAPTITLGSTPAAIATTTTATFTWTSSEPGAYSCRIDTALFASCGSGTSGTKTFTGLTQGNHTFNVRARDAAGNLSATTSFSWAVDTGPPDTTIGTKPTNPTASTSASFTFTATEPSTFKCKLDNAAVFSDCTSPQSYTSLADGSHTFAVEAVDTVGNVDPTPATFTWLVDVTNPTGSISTPTEGAVVSGATQQVTALAADNVSVLSVQFKLDGADLGTPVTAAPYTVTWDTTNTADGPHSLTAVIKDEVANTTTTAPVHVTVQNTAVPTSTASPDLVDVGPGSVDATTRNVMRTGAGRVYIIANDDTAAVNNPVHSATGPGVIRAYKGNQAGTPTAFAEVDGAHRPSSSGTTAFSGVDVRLGSNGIAHTLFSDNATDNVNRCIGTLLYRPFSTVTDTWGATETIATCVGSQPRGRIAYSLAVDSSNVPHIVFAKGGSLFYANRAGGTWSAPVAIATGAPTHPMLAFDANGVLHLAWLEDNGSGSSLRYAVRSGAAWSAPELIPTGAILSNANADQGPSIATDAAGHPYVLYVGPSAGTFGPTGHTAIYGPMQAMEKVGGSWTDVSPPGGTGYLSHTPQIYTRGTDIYAFDGHDTDINFAYARKLGAGSWSSLTKLTTRIADGSASIRWDPLHETDPSIIDASTYDEDRLGDRSFLGEVYYMAVKPSVADTTAPTVSLTAPAAGTVTGTVTVSANASDNIGVAGVTFMLDGSSIAAEDTTSPYSINWDSTTAANGTHTLTAVARDAAGNTATSAPVSITVSNAAAPPPSPGAVLFGSSTIFATADTNVAGAMEAFDVGTVTAGSLARMHVFLDAPLPPTLLVALYADNAGSPATLLSSTSIVTPVVGWNDVAFGPVAITAGNRYWIALLTPTGLAGGPHFRVAKTGGAGVFVSAPALSAFPATFPTTGTKNVDGPLAAWGSS